MTAYFIDTSSVAKRYILEIGSAWIRKQTELKNGNMIVISELTTVELCSLLTRKRFENQISTEVWLAIQADFLVHAERDYSVIPIHRQVIVRARDLVGLYPLLRSLDAIQLATAIGSRSSLGSSLIFVAADQRLLGVAAAEGFQVENPLNHP